MQLNNETDKISNKMLKRNLYFLFEILFFLPVSKTYQQFDKTHQVIYDKNTAHIRAKNKKGIDMEIYYTLIERDAENFIAFCEKNYFDKHQTKESSNKLEKVSEILNDMSCDKISSHIHDLNTSETTIKQHMAIYSIKMIRNDDIYKLK